VGVPRFQLAVVIISAEQSGSESVQLWGRAAAAAGRGWALMGEME
jgi:hypothetical protein